VKTPPPFVRLGPGDGMATVYGAPWVRVKLRKPAACAVTARALKAGDLAYRPVTNGSHRAQRVAAVWMEGR